MALTEVDTKGIKNASIKLEDIENGTSSDAGKFLKNNDGAAPSWAAVDTSNITVADDNTTTTTYPVFTTAATGATAPKTNEDKLKFNASTGTLEATHLSTIASGGTITAYGPGTLGGITDSVYLNHNGITISGTATGSCELRFLGSNIGAWVGFKSSGSFTSGTTIWTLPEADGTADQVLKTNGSATLSWGDAGAGATGGGTNKIFWENEKVIDYNYTITNNHNAMTAGPVEIAATGNGDGSAVVVTVGDGETWTIL